MFRAFRISDNRRWRSLGMLFLFMFLISGCSLGAKPSYLVNQYAFEYPSPFLKELTSINELVRVEPFSVAQVFNTSAMIYKDGPNLRNVDPYNRWRTKPGDMVAEYLARDLRNSGLFRAVISYNDSEETRYLLEGQVDEFLEVSERDGRKAVLSLHVTFLDLKKRDTAERVIFQRDYSGVEPYPEKTPAALAHGMSGAMQKISRQIILDLQEAVRNR
ncbi:MAG TPA: ABC-type transport auxiliary lipoprotein family protein [Thermodesulfobacteriota bacterium]|nr:ABC-type transport auxiliary lipoprotein family protein [Thermodesulfobacteriota bacterium]